MATITPEDDDLKALRASSWALNELRRSLPDYIASSGTSGISETSSVKEDGSIKQVQTIVDLLNIFQEDPQLLDPHLKELLPPVAAKLSDLLVRDDFVLLNDLSKIIYHFCKVRGAKVITRFFDNEPQNLHPSLQLLGLTEVATGNTVMSDPAAEDAATSMAPDDIPTSLSWEAKYVLLLWVAHLMLTPFDLASVSELAAEHTLEDARLPSLLPAVALEVLTTCSRYLSTASNEQSAACTALVKLSLRPDMRKLGLLDVMIRNLLDNFSSGPQEDLHSLNGQFMFLNGIVSSANANDIHQHLLPIFTLVNSIFYHDSDKYAELRSSAVSKKLAIKILRNLTSQILQHEKLATSFAQAISMRMMQKMGALEDVIDFLLRCLADRDTQVRHAASKALSVLTTKLDREMAEEVVEAVLGSLNESVFRHPETGLQSTSAVNPVRWHGLTLTLSHMLFRRSPGPEQLKDVLQALFNTLSFEQRSATGNSLGSNVRDAANFGLWSLARRYSTKELLAVELDVESASSNRQTTIQRTACHLLVTACLDPAGNIRRGSSAALQELIGRHPDTIIEGISLVQTVDYHAVGLRERAMISVAFDAAKLSDLHHEIMLEGLFGWHGLQAPDPASREFAAAAIGQLVNMKSAESVSAAVASIKQELISTSPREVERRHGLILALAAVIGTLRQRTAETGMALCVSQAWPLFDKTITIQAKDLLTPSMRSDLTISAILALINAITSSCQLRRVKERDDIVDRVLTTFNICLTGKAVDSITTLPETCRNLMQALQPEDMQTLVKSWLKVVETKLALGTKEHGIIIALGSVHSVLSGPHKVKERMIDILVSAASSSDVDIRVVAIRSLALTIDTDWWHEVVGRYDSRITETLDRGLNDYTMNERGDVGSLVRFQALLAVQKVWSVGREPFLPLICLSTVQRLALERLDKVRLQAAKCLGSLEGRHFASIPDPLNVSSYEYFISVGNCILACANRSDNLSSSQDHLEALLTGFASSAGIGAKSLSETSRQALHDLLTLYPPDLTESRHLSNGVTLPGIASTLSELIATAIKSANDRLLVPLLTTLAFLLDTHIIHPLLSSDKPNSPVRKSPSPLQWLSLTQKAHYKSTSLPKLLICIDIYRTLSEFDSIRIEVLKKLISMLLHPFPRVRVAAAEALWVACMGKDEMKDVMAILGQEKWAENVDGKMKEVVKVIRGKIVG